MNQVRFGCRCTGKKKKGGGVYKEVSDEGPLLHAMSVAAGVDEPKSPSKSPLSLDGVDDSCSPQTPQSALVRDTAYACIPLDS